MNSPEVALGEVADIVMGQSPEGACYNATGEGLPLITGAGQFGETYPEASQFSRAGAKKSRRGDILVCIRATIGDLNWSDREYYLGRGVAAVRTGPKLDVRYAWHALQRKKRWLEDRATGSTFKQIKRRDLESVTLYLPSLDEQRRIAAILDQSEGLQAKRSLALLHLDTLLTSTFLDLFGDPVTNSKHAERKRIGEIGPVVTGTTPSRAKPEYYGTAIEWIKSDNLNTPHHYLTKAEEGLSVEGIRVARTAPAGAILVTCIAGSPDCIGNAGIADREVAFNQQINALIPHVGDYRFLYTQILVGKGLFRRASTAAMKGMISKSRFAEIPLLFPSLDRQQSFGQVFERIHVLKQTQLASLGKLDALFASLQHRAFRGEL